MAIIMLRKAVNSSWLKPIKTTACRLPARSQRGREQQPDQHDCEAQLT